MSVNLLIINLHIFVVSKINYFIFYFLVLYNKKTGIGVFRASFIEREFGTRITHI